MRRRDQPVDADRDPLAQARLHASLRFGVGVTAALLLCEAMTWRPTFLAPLLAGTLLANLPGRPPGKLGVVIIGSMALSALFVFVLSSVLDEMHTVLFVAIALCLFATFLAMLRGAPALPALFLLISLATIPVVAIAYPAQADKLPWALARGIVIAMAVVYAVYKIWPATVPPKPKAAVADASASGGGAGVSDVAMAGTATMIVVPLMLAFLLLSPTDAMPALIATIMLVSNFHLQAGKKQAVAMVIGNAAGGVLGMAAYWVLLVHPTLGSLALITLALALALAGPIANGSPITPLMVLVSNAFLIIFSSSIAAGPGNPELWIKRVIYFSLAGLFAIGAMHLLWHRARPASPQPA